MPLQPTAGVRDVRTILMVSSSFFYVQRLDIKLMLAYLFWHRPQPDATPQAYEAALVAFHEGLAKAAPHGLLGSATYWIDAVPWLRGRSGYEDWYLVEGFGALQSLTQPTVAGSAKPIHDMITERSSVCHGGLYRLVAGEAAAVDQSTVWWLTRPRGVSHESLVEDLCLRLGSESSGWRRMLTLGPAPELALVTGSRLTPALPSGWKAVPVARHALWSTSGSTRRVLSS